MKDMKSLIESDASAEEILQEASKSSIVNFIYNKTEDLNKKHISALDYAITRGGLTKDEIGMSNIDDIIDNLKDGLKLMQKIKKSLK